MVFNLTVSLQSEKLPFSRFSLQQGLTVEIKLSFGFSQTRIEALFGFVTVTTTSVTPTSLLLLNELKGIFS